MDGEFREARFVTMDYRPSASATKENPGWAGAFEVNSLNP
jgi:hypothetical protein